MTISKKILIALSAFLSLMAIACHACAVTYEYDDLNRLYKVTYDNGYVIVYDYDEVGNRKSEAVYSTPTAKFTASPASGYVPFVVRFTDTSSGNITSWFWSFGDGETSTEKSPSHAYNKTGMFLARLTATNPSGSSSYSLYINATPKTPVRIARATPLYYTSLQDACNNAVTGDTIQTTAVTIIESLTLSSNVSITFDGGYAGSYNSIIGLSVLKGNISITNGTIRMGNILID